MTSIENAARDSAVLALLDSGMSFSQVAHQIGVTRSTIAGIKSRAGRCVPKDATAPSTMPQRLDALHARLDSVMAETAGVGRMPNEPRNPIPRRTRAL